MALLIGSLTGYGLNAPAVAAAGTADTLTLSALTTNGLLNPPGIDTPKPRLAWDVTSPGLGASVSAAQVRVWKNTPSNTVWDSGKITAAGIDSVVYDGPALDGRSLYGWQVRVYDEAGAVTGWSPTATFGTAMMSPADWGDAQWITHPDWKTPGGPGNDPGLQPVTIPLTGGPATTRYLTLEVNGLGAPVSGDSGRYLQLAELEARDGAGGVNVAKGAAVTSSESIDNWGWSTSFLTDGVRDSATATARGYSSQPHTSASLNQPITLTVDLGSVQKIDRIVLYPRSDARTADGRSPNFPTAVTVRAADSTAGWSGVAANDNVPNPAYSTQGNPYTIDLGRPTTTSKLTLAVPEVSDVYADTPNGFMLQLAEVELLDQAGNNVARSRPVTTSAGLEEWGWGRGLLTDGVTNTNNGQARGFTTWPPSPNQVLTANGSASPATITIDLGAEKTVSKVKVYPRTDKSQTVAGSPATVSFMKSFQLTAFKPVLASYANTTPPPAPQPRPVSLPLLRTDFTADKAVKSARLYVAGLGAYVAYVNDQRAGDAQLGSPWSRYDERVHYDTIDVTSAVKQGANAIGIALGQGYFEGVHDWVSADRRGAWDGVLRTRAVMEVTYTDGTSKLVTTGPQWTTDLGPTLPFTASTPDSEGYDARLEQDGWSTAGFDAGNWKPAVTVNQPATVQLQASPVPPTRVSGTLNPVSVASPATGVRVYDFGQNIAGNARVTFDLPAGTQVNLRYGEKLSNGRVVVVHGRYQDDTFTDDGKAADAWTPAFTYRGFRYLEISNLPAGAPQPQVQALRMHNDLTSVGTFSSGNDTLNWIHQATRDTLLNNAVQGVPTDGSYVEKLPWLADGALMEEAMRRNFDTSAFYAKWFNDIVDSQVSNGDMPMFAPIHGDTARSSAWANAVTETAVLLLQHGQRDVVAARYDELKKYAEFEWSQRASTQEMWGDWVCPDTDCNSDDNKAFVGKAYRYRSVDQFADIAQQLGKSSDAALFADRAEQMKSTFNSSFYDAANHLYRSKPGGAFWQTNNVLPLEFGLAPEADTAAIAQKINNDVQSRGNHLGTGVLGTKYLLRVLTEFGYVDTAYAVASSTTYPSWGYWKSLGATSLWEEWGAWSRSQGHPFLGTVEDWLLMDLAGIESSEGEAVIKPHVPTGLDRASSSLATSGGSLSSSWKVSGSALTLDVTIPVSRTALVHVPVKAGQNVVAPTGAQFVSDEPGFKVYRVASGSYQFTAQ
ncbi:family 78 glycoside hydrolase catalytic domain [Streptomyces sp. TLI_053]|uniref:family 78 glycoside hydrolase catalytic domain n=1 Tax=Streptomyces sp. TLI_053 TaxID=1855352 RepID=UPI0013520AE5|nr:family 78 glycoside hydrolase catalytic domain [Streptomyces sp. TLI_053]